MVWWWFSCQVVSHSCLPMGCSPSGFSVHGIFNTGVGCHFLLQGIFWTQESNRVSCIAGRFFTCKTLYYGVSAIIIPTLQMKELKHRDIDSFT